MNKSNAPHSNTQPYWLRRGVKAKALWPLSLLFAGVSQLRHCWLHRVKKPWKASVPVIIVGNLTVGGAGKTPTLLALIDHMLKAGHHPAVISRGYGRKDTTSCSEVETNSAPQDVGDEPLLIKRHTGVPVFVAAKRILAAQAALKAYPQTTVILSDDGLQHYALGRDIEIAIFDDRGAGNGWLIPAGPLREPLSRLKQVDLILYNASKPPLPIAGFMAHRALGGYLPLSHWLEQQAQPHGSPPQWQPMQELVSKQQAQKIRISAVAGIGNPQRFFDMITDLGIVLDQTLALPDHHDYKNNPFDTIDAEIILITEKDAAKCLPYQNNTQLYVVTLAYTPEPAFFNRLDGLLNQLNPDSQATL